MGAHSVGLVVNG